MQGKTTNSSEKRTFLENFHNRLAKEKKLLPLLQQKLKVLKEENLYISKKLSQLKDEHDGVCLQYTEARMRTEQFFNEARRAAVKNYDLTKANEELKAENEALKAENQALKEKIAKQQAIDQDVTIKRNVLPAIKEKYLKIQEKPTTSTKQVKLQPIPSTPFSQYLTNPKLLRTMKASSHLNSALKNLVASSKKNQKEPLIK